MSIPGPQLPGDHPLRRLPDPAKRMLNGFYWLAYDSTDFAAEAIGWLPSHLLRLFLYRYLLRTQVGSGSSIHRGCRIYRPSGVQIGTHTIVNRDVLLDGRTGLQIGNRVSISEGSMILTLGHPPESRGFESSGAPVRIEDLVFVGVRAIILPGISVGEGSVVGAGAVVTRDVPAYTIVGGVPAKFIGSRERNLDYSPKYRKFLG